VVIKEQKPEENKEKDGVLSKSDLIAFAFDLGFAIVIPLVIFALGGRFLDKKFETSPLFLIIGLLISIVFTGISIYKKTKKYTK
jgi:F0F1-type ATP synthase assembly protein I